MANNPPTLPAFLKQSKADLHSKFVDLEWQQRNRLLHGTQHSTASPSPWARLTGPSIASRNRYLNVEPFAANRIKLRVGSPNENDYINASPISLGNRRYIATQGPKDTSVAHFYRMLVEEAEDPAVVVMLTQTHEAGREKCYQYYPLNEEESPLQLPVKSSEAQAAEENGQDGEAFKGEVQLVSLERHTPSRSEIRRLKLKTGHQSEREVRHLLFSGWPDFLIPEGEDRAALVELVRLSASLTSRSTRPNTPLAATLSSVSPSNPRIVHCSAGVGRSGTFIALDYLLNEMFAGRWDSLAKGRDPVAETVDELRKQRMMMVQGEGQFMFLYEVLREEWGKRWSGGGDATEGAGR